MRSNHWRKTVLLPVLALLCISASARAGQQQEPTQNDPVADAARKARADKKDTPKPKKVITDDDIRPRVPDTPPQNAAANGPTGDASANGDAQNPKDGGKQKNDEATWRKRFQDQRNKISSAEKELDVLQRESDKAQLQYYSDPQKSLNEQFSRKEINEKRDKIEAKKQEIEKLKQGLDDLESELRQAGGDPGWARE